MKLFLTRSLTMLIFLNLVACGKMTMNNGIGNLLGLTPNPNSSGVSLPSENFLEAKIVLQKCTTCHSPTGSMAKASFVFSSEEEAFASPWFQKGNIESLGLVRTKGSGGANATMPLEGSWSAEEYETLKNWVLQGGSEEVASIESTAKFQSLDIPVMKTSFEITYEVSPLSDKIDAFTGVSVTTPAAPADVAAIVRFNNFGFVDVRNGSIFTADNIYSYSAKKVYRVRMLIYPTAKNYSVYVSNDGQPEVQLANLYSFRTEQASAASFSKISVVAFSGSHRLSRVQTKEIQAPALSCGATPNGGTETRVRYQSLSVAAGKKCLFESQTRTCVNGVFSAFTGTYTQTTCVVESGPGQSLACGEIASGSSVSRIRYQSASVPFGQNCVSEAQVQTCQNGVLSPFTGTYTQISCAVQPDTSTPFGKAQVVLQKCIGCHGPGGQMAAKSFVFSSETEAFASPWFKKGNINSPALVRTIGSGSATANMPPNGITWSASEYALLKDWIVGTTVNPPVTPPVTGGGTPLEEDPTSQLVCANESDVGASDNHRLSKDQLTNTMKLLFGDNIVSLKSGTINTGTEATINVSAGTTTISNQTQTVTVNWDSTSGAQYHFRVKEMLNDVATSARISTYTPRSGYFNANSGIYLYVDNFLTNNVSFAVRPGYKYHLWVHTVINGVVGQQKNLYFSTTATPGSSLASQSPESPLFTDLPDDGVYWKFDKGALNVTGTHIQSYLDLGIAVADTVYNDTNKRAAVFGTCANTSPLPANCIDNYLSGFATKVFRRPLTDTEKANAKSIFYEAGSGGEGFIRVLAYHLISPDFLVRWELGGASTGTGPLADSEKLFKLSNYELASKISFLVNDTAPDDELLAKAADGTLANDAVIRSQVVRLLGTPKAREKFGKLGFFWAGDDLNFNFTIMPSAFLNGININNLGGAAKDETERFMQYIIWDGQKKFSDLLTSKVSFANDSGLAAIYNHSPAGVVPATFGDDRKGLFNRLPFLYNFTTRSSIIQRGVKFRKNVLCQDIPSPSPDVFALRDADNLTDEQAILLSTRDVTAHRTKSMACMGCHSVINPTGNMFENFDSIGRYRLKERVFNSSGVLTSTVSVNSQGTIPLWTGVQVTADAYSDFIEKVADTETVKACFAKKLVSFSNTIKHLDAKDSCKVKKVMDELVKSDGTVFNAVVNSIANPSLKFRRVGQ